MNATAVERVTPPQTEPSNRERRVLPPSIGFLVKWGIFALVGIGVVLSVVLGLVQKWLWMRQLDYEGVFWTLLSVKWGLFGVTLIVSVFCLWLNLRFAARNIDLVNGDSFFNKAFTHPADSSRTINIDISARLLIFAIDFAIVVLSLIFALSVSGQWDTFLRFRYGGSFGIADPLFGVDLGFRILRLPFYELLQGCITVLTVSALAILTFCSVFGLRQSKSTERLRCATAPFGTLWCYCSYSRPTSVGVLFWTTMSWSIDPRRRTRSRLCGRAHHESRALGDDRCVGAGLRATGHWVLLSTHQAHCGRHRGLRGDLRNCRDGAAKSL